MTRKSRISQYSSSKKTQVDLKNLLSDYELQKKDFILSVYWLKLKNKK